jgi:hypothetical protein
MVELDTTENRVILKTMGPSVELVLFNRPI